MKYTIKQLRAEFGTDAKCLQFVFNNRYKAFVCPQCKAIGKFYLIESRKRFDCVCGFTVSPLSGTIFHKSSTPLIKWFEAIYLFTSKDNISAKELQRELKVTYKCAWLIRKQIKSIGENSFKKILLTAVKIPISQTKIHYDYKERYHARYLVAKAIKQNKIKKPKTCELCGKEGRIEGHHEDYSKPLEVMWLCNQCHEKQNKSVLP